MLCVCVSSLGVRVYNSNIPFSPVIFHTEDDGVVIRGEHYANFIADVRVYRTSSGGDLTPGWEERLCQVLYEEYPNQKGWLHLPKLQPVRKLTLSDVGVFLRSMKRWQAFDKTFVPEGVAEARARKCVDCVNNVSITGCFGCSNVLPAVLKAVNGRKTKVDEQLRGCMLCGCVLKAKVHLPVEVMVDSAMNVDDYPDHCWLKAEISNL